MTKKSSQFESTYIKGRPLIMAKLSNEGISRYFEFLIDSGADYTIISKSCAVILGIDVKKLKKDCVELADLSSIKAYKIRLTISINGFDFKIPVLIADSEVECLLGRKGVFEKFDILFKEKDRVVKFIKRN